MCDKHEVEGVDYERCDYCGAKYPCGQGFEVWQSQARNIYFYWCDECKSTLAYKCHICGELFDEATGYVVTSANEDDGSQYYACYDCLLKEHGRDRDGLFMWEFIRDMQLSKMDKENISRYEFEKTLELNQLLALWTSFCLKYQFFPDTASYDREFLVLYTRLHNAFPTLFIWRPDDMDEDEKSLMDWLDLFMGQYLV